MTDDLIDAMLRASGTRELLAVRTEAGAFWTVDVVAHPDPVLHVVLEGGAIAAFGGTRAHLHEGDVLWVPARTPIRLGSGGSEASHLCPPAAARRSVRDGSPIRFGQGALNLRLLSVRYRREPGDTCLLEAVRTPLRVSAEQDRGLLAVARDLDRELSERREGLTTAAAALVDLLLVRAARQALSAHPLTHDRAASHADHLVNQALATVTANPGREWSTTELADALRVSRSTLHRHFLRTVGASPQMYLTERRLNAAALRLRDSDDSIDRIALLAGYRSSHAFRRAFHRLWNESPSDHRRRARTAVARAT